MPARHAVGIQHRDDLEHEMLPQQLGPGVVRQQELHRPVQREARWCLTRMDTGAQQHNWLAREEGWPLHWLVPVLQDALRPVQKRLRCLPQCRTGRFRAHGSLGEKQRRAIAPHFFKVALTAPVCIRTADIGDGQQVDAPSVQRANEQLSAEEDRPRRRSRFLHRFEPLLALLVAMGIAKGHKGWEGALHCHVQRELDAKVRISQLVLQRPAHFLPPPVRRGALEQRPVALLEQRRMLLHVHHSELDAHRLRRRRLKEPNACFPLVQSAPPANRVRRQKGRCLAAHLEVEPAGVLPLLYRAIAVRRRPKLESAVRRHTSRRQIAAVEAGTQLEPRPLILQDKRRPV
eukprot:scaffold613_cov243-Pinguiococcus_pyrenoidosus.AAC.10